jgi:methionyl-tRNA formyltransferase
MTTHIIATSREWRPGIVDRLTKRTAANFVLITEKAALTPERLAEIRPARVFFPHWSYIIPREIYDQHECIIFHMTDVPFGRGGSPLQNLIARGIYETKISALRCVAELDAGPVYLKKSFSLAEGSARDLYRSAFELIENMIEAIVRTDPKPVEQTGEPIVFKRRRPGESDISGLAEVRQLYDFIRMLDADGYPAAFLETAHLRFEFREARLAPEGVDASVKIFRKGGGSR